MILVTGFGAFAGVDDNPSGRAAQQIDGRRVRGEPVIGMVLPVSYARGPELAIRTARTYDARLVIGLGVATQRKDVEVERIARRTCGPAPDVDGVTLSELGDHDVPATIDVDAFAKALKGRVSDDAGGYVCNAWLWTVAGSLSVPVGFVHVPAGGIGIERLIKGLEGITAP